MYESSQHLLVDMIGNHLSMISGHAQPYISWEGEGAGRGKGVGRGGVYYYSCTLALALVYTVPGQKSWTAGCFLKQNYPKYRLCERDMGGSYLL